MQRFVVPVPWKRTEVPKRIQKYMSCPWRNKEMSLVEWMRRTTNQGDIHKWVKEAHKKAQRIDGYTGDLIEFANEVKPEGQVMIANIVLSRYKDEYYGQWVLLNVPFR